MVLPGSLLQGGVQGWWAALKALKRQYEDHGASRYDQKLCLRQFLWTFLREGYVQQGKIHRGKNEPPQEGGHIMALIDWMMEKEMGYYTLPLCFGAEAVTEEACEGEYRRTVAYFAQLDDPFKQQSVLYDMGKILSRYCGGSDGGYICGQYAYRPRLEREDLRPTATAFIQWYRSIGANFPYLPSAFRTRTILRLTENALMKLMTQRHDVVTHGNDARDEDAHGGDGKNSNDDDKDDGTREDTNGGGDHNVSVQKVRAAISRTDRLEYDDDKRHYHEGQLVAEEFAPVQEKVLRRFLNVVTGTNEGPDRKANAFLHGNVIRYAADGAAGCGRCIEELPLSPVAQDYVAWYRDIGVVLPELPTCFPASFIVWRSDAADDEEGEIVAQGQDDDHAAVRLRADDELTTWRKRYDDALPSKQKKLVDNWAMALRRFLAEDRLVPPTSVAGAVASPGNWSLARRGNVSYQQPLPLAARSFLDWFQTKLKLIDTTWTIDLATATLPPRISLRPTDDDAKTDVSSAASSHASSTLALLADDAFLRRIASDKALMAKWRAKSGVDVSTDGCSRLIEAWKAVNDDVMAKAAAYRADAASTPASGAAQLPPRPLPWRPPGLTNASPTSTVLQGLAAAPSSQRARGGGSDSIHTPVSIGQSGGISSGSPAPAAATPPGAAAHVDGVRDTSFTGRESFGAHPGFSSDSFARQQSVGSGPPPDAGTGARGDEEAVKVDPSHVVLRPVALPPPSSHSSSVAMPLNEPEASTAHLSAADTSLPILNSDPSVSATSDQQGGGGEAMHSGGVDTPSSTAACSPADSSPSTTSSSRSQDDDDAAKPPTA